MTVLHEFKTSDIKKILKDSWAVEFEGEDYLLLTEAEYSSTIPIGYYCSSAIKLNDFYSYPNKEAECMKLEKYQVRWDILYEHEELVENQCDWNSPSDVCIEYF